MLPLASLPLTPDYGNGLWALSAHGSVSVSPLVQAAYNCYDAGHMLHQGEGHQVERILEWRLDFKPIL